MAAQRTLRQDRQDRHPQNQQTIAAPPRDRWSAELSELADQYLQTAQPNSADAFQTVCYENLRRRVQVNRTQQTTPALFRQACSHGSPPDESFGSACRN